MKKTIVIELSSGKKIEMTEEEFEELQKSFSGKETIVYKFYPYSYPICPSYPTYPSYPIMYWSTTDSTISSTYARVGDSVSSSYITINNDNGIYTTRL